MFKVRLFDKGGNPREHVVTDLEIEVLPQVGDMIEIDMGRDVEPTLYRVISRVISQSFRDDMTQIGESRFAVEVEQKKPGRYSLTDVL